MKALNDRMKLKETTNENWPELEENPLLPLTHQTQNPTSTIVDLSNSNELTPSITKEDLNQPYFDTEEQSST